MISRPGNSREFFGRTRAARASRWNRDAPVASARGRAVSINLSRVTPVRIAVQRVAGGSYASLSRCSLARRRITSLLPIPRASLTQ